MWAMVVVAALAADEVPDRNKEGLKRLQGSWKVESLTRDGKEVAGVKKFVWKFDGKKFVVVKGDKQEKGTFELVTDKLRGPFTGGTIDVTPAGKGKAVLGVYWLEDDRLLLNFGAPGAERPKGYVPRRGAKGEYWVLDRVTK